MNNQNFTTTLIVSKTANEVFNGINNVSKWWTENLEGSSQKLNDEFTVRFGDIHYSKQKVIEVIPDKKVVWLVTDSKLNWLTDKHEWTNTKISFEISNNDNKTQLHFTHMGLVPDVECYDNCVKGWNQFVNESLFKLITEGQGQPDLAKI